MISYNPRLLLLGPQLCNTNGCLFIEHVIIEKFSINSNRQACSGVTLLFRPPIGDAPHHTIKTELCPYALGEDPTILDPFVKSCRKLQLLIQGSFCVNYFPSTVSQ